MRSLGGYIPELGRDCQVTACRDNKVRHDWRTESQGFWFRRGAASPQYTYMLWM
jgi:hypothetical protein